MNNQTINEDHIVNEDQIAEPTLIPILLNYKTLEKYFGLSPSTIQKMVMNGTFTNVVKVGRKNYFRTSDVLGWIDNQTIEVA